MKLRFMRLGVVCEALTDSDGFAWTTSIIDENVWSLVSPQEQHHLSSIFIRCLKIWGDRSLYKLSNKGHLLTETILVASQNQASYPTNLCSIATLILVDLLYAYFLEIDREKAKKKFIEG